MDYGTNLKLARKWAKITQKALAEKAGIAPITIHQYEAGKRKPSLENWFAIAEALNLSLDELNNASLLFEDIEAFDTGETFDNRWKELTDNHGKSDDLDIAIHHKANGTIRIEDHRKERLNKIYDQLDSGRQGQLVKYGEFLLSDSENEKPFQD